MPQRTLCSICGVGLVLAWLCGARTTNFIVDALRINNNINLNININTNINNINTDINNATRRADHICIGGIVPLAPMYAALADCFVMIMLACPSTNQISKLARQQDELDNTTNRIDMQLT